MTPKVGFTLFAEILACCTDITYLTPSTAVREKHLTVLNGNAARAFAESRSTCPVYDHGRGWAGMACRGMARHKEGRGSTRLLLCLSLPSPKTNDEFINQHHSYHADYNNGCAATPRWYRPLLGRQNDLSTF